MFLFRVENTFNLTGIGLALTPGVENNLLRSGNVIKLILPDGIALETKIFRIGWVRWAQIIIVENIKKEDVPTGTEVWLIE